MTTIDDPTLLPSWDLPAGVTARFVDTSPVGLKFHILEALPPSSSYTHRRPPLILLLHGFPNLSYDWRFVLPRLAQAGYYAVAPDMRGFGRSHNADLSAIQKDSIRSLTAVADVVALVHALGYESIHTLVGHDLGAFVAAITSLFRPDMVKSLVLMAHPWKGIPRRPLRKDGPPAALASVISAPEISPWEQTRDPDIQSSLAKLDPPRRHYKWYNASEGSSNDWTFPTGQPLRDFLRGYFHVKSGAYTRNKPRPLRSWTAEELAVMPHYYIMRADLGVRENIQLDMAGEPQDVVDHLAETPWLTDADLGVYEDEFARNTFHHALLWYRALTNSADLSCLAGRKLSMPTKYVSGSRDWGTYQDPGALEACEQGVSVEPGCWRGAVHLDGAGHWVNMEKSMESADEILRLAGAVGG